MKHSPELTAQVLALAGVTVAPAGSLASVELPIPPSVNNLFFTKGRRRIKSAEYRKWTERAVPLLRKLRPVAPPVEIRVTVRGKVNVQRDLDNLLKPIGDTLVEAEVIVKDSIRYVRGWTVEIEFGTPGEPRVEIEVWRFGTSKAEGA